MTSKPCRYAAFLRGINVGGNNKIAMPQLRALAMRLGFADVGTYINSGNLVFTCDNGRGEAALAVLISAAIEDESGLKIDVAVRTEAQLDALLRANPYPDGDPSRVTVAFLMSDPPPGTEERLTAAADEPFTVTGRDIWVNYTQGQASSKLAAQFSKVIGVSATVRNVRTVTKTRALLES